MTARNAYIPRVSGAKGGKGGGGGKSFEEAPNTLQSRAVARLVDLLCSGEIIGLVNGGQSIFLDETQLRNENGSNNFDGMEWDFRPGTPDQEHMAGFPSVETETAVNVDVQYGRPVVRSISDQELDAVRVTVNIPALYEQDTDEAEMRRTRVAYGFDVSTDGGPYTRMVTVDMTEKCTSPYRISHRINLPAGKAWDIRMVRLMEDSAKSTLSNKTEWASYTRIIDAKMVYPDTAYVGLKVDSSQFGSSVPQRSYDIYGRIIQIPSNYDPVARTYAGLWDGTFKRAYCNNPAWVIYDVLTDPVNGLGRELTPERIDIWSLYAIAQYNDGLVPDGKGGMEPRYTFNGLINTQEEALNSLAALAGACRCIIYFSAGMVYFAQDRPTPMKRVLAPANVVDGVFNYEGTALKARHTVANISWLDPDDGFKTSVMPVEDARQIRELGWRPTDEVAFGCASPGQAWRFGKFLLEDEKRCTEAVSFATGLDAADLMPGDVVGIFDPSYAGARAGGRLRSIAADTAVLDAPFAFAADESYALCVAMPDGSLQDIPLINPMESADTVAFQEPITAFPVANAIYGILASNLQPRLFRIMGVEEGEGITFNFTGLLYDETKYAYVEENIILPQPPTTLYPTGPLPPPYNLTWREYLYLKTGLTPTAGCTFSWSYDDPRAVAFEVEWMLPNGNGFMGRITISTPTIDLDIMEQGAYTYRVRAVDGLGRTSPWATITVLAMGLWTPPSNVRNFLGVANGEWLTLSWDQTPDLHLDHYELRFSAAADLTWDSAQIIDAAIGKNQTSIMVPLQAGTYMIKAVSIKDVYSSNATALYNGIATDITLLNVVEDLAQHPEWLGEKTGTAKSGALLTLDRTVTSTYADVYAVEDSYAPRDVYSPAILGGYVLSGVYYFYPSYIDLSAIYDSRIIPTLVYNGTSLTSDVFAMPDVHALPDVYDVEQNPNYRVTLEYSTTDDAPQAPAGLDLYASADVYGETDLYEYDETSWSDWTPVHGPVTVRARGYRFRLILESLDGFVSPAVGVCRITLDMPDRIIAVDDFLMPALAGGYYFAFTPPFKNSPALSNPMIQDGETTDWWEITEKTRGGFRLKLFNRETLEPISRLIDWTAKGYGAEQIATGETI